MLRHWISLIAAAIVTLGGGTHRRKTRSRSFTKAGKSL